MNVVDLVLGLILLYGLVRGFFRGFIAELASLLAFIIGIYVAVYFSYIISDFIADKVTWNIQFVHLIGFAITFLIVVLIISIIAKVLTTAANFVFLGIINKLLGAALGLIKVAFITSVIIMLLSATNEDMNLIEEETLNESKLFGPIKVIAPAVTPAILKKVRELDFIEEDDTEPSQNNTI